MIKFILIRLAIFLSLSSLTIALLAVARAPSPAPPVLATDKITLPAEHQSFETGTYRLEIMSEPEWRSPRPTATLYNGDTRLWEKEIPHQYGPRFSLVTSEGQVVLFDEYINVASPYAIALIHTTGETTSTYSFDDIQEFLQDVSRADLTRQATSGWWISSPPQLDEAEQNALVQTGGTTLQIDLSTGELSRRDDLSPNPSSP